MLCRVSLSIIHFPYRGTFRPFPHIKTAMHIKNRYAHKKTTILTLTVQYGGLLANMYIYGTPGKVLSFD